jgi:hypothetical protein
MKQLLLSYGWFCGWFEIRAPVVVQGLFYSHTPVNHHWQLPYELLMGVPA